MSNSLHVEGLVSRLSRATEEGRIKWSETADEDSFRASFKNGFIRISKRNYVYREDGARPSDLALYVLNKEGKVVGEYAPTGSDAQNFNALFDRARRSARDAESVLVAIIEELDD